MNEDERVLSMLLALSLLIYAYKNGEEGIRWKNRRLLTPK